MKKLGNFIRATIAGGIIFLIPVVAILFILGKAIGALRSFSTPIAEKLSFTQIGGVGIISIISIFLLLLICFFAGIFMRTATARKIIRWIEDKVLIYIPGYSYLQALSVDLFSSESSNWKPAIVFIDDNEVICFVIDETGDYCTIFLPSAPSPSSGSVCAREKSKVTYLPLSMSETVLMIRQFGKGAASVINKIKSAEQQQ